MRQDKKINSEGRIAKLIRLNFELANYFRIAPALEIIIYLIGCIQPLTFLLYTDVSAQHIILSNETNMNINYQQVILFTTRPDYYYQSSYSYLIPFLAILILDILSIALIIGSDFVLDSLIDKFSKHLLVSVLSVYNQIYTKILIIPFACLSCISIFLTLKEPQSYINLILSLLTFTLILLIQFIKIFTCSSKLLLNKGYLSPIHLTLFDSCEQVLYFMQYIVFILFNQSNGSQSLQAILIMLISICRIINIFQLTQCQNFIVFLLIIISSFGLTLPIIIILTLEETYTLFTIIVPLCSLLIWKFYQSYLNQIFNNILTSKSFNQVRYFMIAYLNNLQSNRFQISYIIILNKLINDQSQEIISHPIQLLQKEFVNINYISEFYLYKIKKLNKQAGRVASLNQNNNRIVHIQILYHLRLNNLAFKQITLLLINSSDPNPQFKIESQSSHRMISHQSKIAGSASKSFDSKSLELGNREMQRIKKTNKYLIDNNISLNLFDKIKCKMLNKKIKKNIETQFQLTHQQNKTQRELQASIKLFLESESLNLSINNKILHLLEAKLYFLQNQQSYKVNQLFTEAVQLCLSIIKIEDKLQKLYQQFPSQRIQSVLCYFQSQVVNNFLEAYRIKSFNSIEEEQLQNMQFNIKSNLMNRNVCYIIVSQDDASQQLLIEAISDNAVKFFKTKNEYLKVGGSLNQLIPDAVVKEHSLLVQRFLQTGSSKFYINNTISFAKQQNGYIKTFNFYFDLMFPQNNKIQFASFYEPLETPSAYILLDVDQNIGGITKNFMDKVHRADTDYVFQNLNGANIEQFIPSFRQLVQLDHDLLKIRLQLPKVNVSVNTLTSIVIDDLFTASIIIHSNELYGFYYTVIEFREITQNKIEPQILNEQLNISISEATINQPNHLELAGNIIKINSPYLHQDANPIMFSKKIDFILSPNQSILNLNAEDSNIRFKGEQLSFFNNQQEHNSSAQYTSNLIKIDQYEEYDINMVNTIKKQLEEQIDNDQQSQTSLAGVKKSQFYKKYELITRSIQPIASQQIKLFVLLLLAQIILACVHYIILLEQVNTDLDVFIKQFDMVAIHMNIMGPHDIFLAQRMAIVTYAAYLTANQINATQYATLTNILYTNIAYGYDLVKNNFQDALSNPYLIEFFINRNITVNFMSVDATKVYQKSFGLIVSFNIFLEYFYQFKVQYEARKSAANQTYQVFQVANVFVYHNLFIELGNDILAYSKTQEKSISNKILIIAIIFMVTSFFLLMLVLYYFNSLQKVYEQYLTIFKYSNPIRNSIDIERYKLMIKFLRTNINGLFNYQFDLDQIESQQFQFKQTQIEQKKIKDHAKSNVQRLYNIQGYLLLIFIWLVYIVTQIIYNGYLFNYLGKYSNTMDFYKLLNDMLYSADLSTYRDFSYIWSNFTYLTAQDLIYENQYLDAGVNITNQYLSLYAQFDQTSYFMTDEFYSYFTQIQQTSICVMLGSTEVDWLSPYCNTSYQGSFQSGLIPTLNFVRSQIQTQRPINHFTKRIDYTYFDNEGGIVLIQTFTILSKMFKKSMVDTTNQQKVLTNALSITYVIFGNLLILFGLIAIYRYYTNQYHVVRRFIQLLSTQILLFDDQLERQIRLIEKANI